MDSKGRVAVPKKFREGMLGIQSDYVGMELVVTNGLSNQLFVYLLGNEWKKTLQRG